jgi:diguanylate cyclase (GGDEF)-like protein/PAS domain S-box-containing protein
LPWLAYGALPELDYIGVRSVRWRRAVARHSEKGDGSEDQLQLLRERVRELERDNERLKGSEERFQALFEHAPDAYYLSDLKGTFVDGNTAAEAITGYKRDELIGKSFLALKLLSPVDLRKAASLLARNLVGHSTGPDELVLTRRDGTRVPLEIRTHPVKIGGRRLVLGIARDVTARNRVEHELRERLKELRAFYNLAEIAERRNASLNEVYQALAHALPHSWQHDDIACARITAGGRVYQTDNFADTPWKQSALIDVDGAVIGSLEVGYLEQRPEEDEGPFLKEERQLIDAVAERLGRITERKQADLYRTLTGEILTILNEPRPLRDSIARVLSAVKSRTGAAAVGMRLQEGDDFPYFVQEGFSQNFLLTENTLLERGADGGVCRDKNGAVSLECTCGLVVSGKTDPSNPLFTGGGSFWTNDSPLLLELPLDEDPRHRPRNTCIHTGYASVALVPIRAKGQIVGLFQLNDHRKGFFSLADIEQLEGIAAHVGEAFVRKQYEEELTHMAHHDPLTGALNRYALDEVLEREASRSKRYSRPIGFLMIDINRFKEINDRFGHAMGDKVLQAMAAVIQGSIRDSDVLVRYGGDEFLVILPETDGESVVVKSRILAEVAQRNETNPLLDFPVTLAVGDFHWSPQSGQTLDQALAAADGRMYEDKRKNRTAE